MLLDINFDKTHRIFSSFIIITCAMLIGSLISPAEASTGHSHAEPSAKQQRILTYGDSNTWGWIPTSEGFPTQRYQAPAGWPNVMASILNQTTDTKVIIDGLVSRTVNLDAGQPVGDIPASAFNGTKHLAATMAINAPLDWVIIMLGTNDLAPAYQRAPKDIAEAAFALAEMARRQNNSLYTTYSAPNVLVITPPPISNTDKTPLHGIFGGAQAPSSELAAAFTKTAQQHPGIHLINAGDVIYADGIDGIHLSRASHQKLGKAIAAYIAQQSAK
ncbi:Uncharacterised protein [BD1-7 clade bacterium]|nr:Uncharacterised protein [BD1-7 clade bacterium]